MIFSEKKCFTFYNQHRDAPGIASHLLLHARVAKLPITLGITVSSMLGYVMALPEANSFFWITAVSALLLTSGSATLNNLQDINWDRELRRTCQRPLPAGLMSPICAGLQGLVLVLLGISGLLMTPGSIEAAGLGLAGVLLYNGVYTPMKQRTIMAIVPGALCGTLPIAMGWAAAGGGMNNPQETALMSVMAVMGVWQLPHFWLILLAHAADYRQAERLSMLSLFSKSQMERILLVWSQLFSIMTIYAAIGIPEVNPIALWILVGNAGFTAFIFALSHFLTTTSLSRIRFTVLNGSMLVFMLVIMADRLALGVIS